MTKTARWLAEAVASFGETCKAKLAGPGDREAAIRAPLEVLLSAVGAQLGVDAVFHDEVRDSERQVRPDYGVSVKGAITGYVEVKAPGRAIAPAGFTGHDKRQWDRQRDLPNLLYTNGTQWRLFRDGELHAGPVTFAGGSLETAGRDLTAPPEFESLITDFLRWKPAPITSVGALVRAVAPLTRLLRGEVLDQLRSEARAIRAGADKWSQPFTGLANDWRALLFPTADDETFADGYAQAVTFALLLARTEGIDVTGQPLHEIGAALGDDHSLMGRALQLLTDDVAADFRVTLDLLVRVVGAVDWPRVRRGRRDTYLHLYENFLEQYDNELRKQSGSYYTPRQVVEEMVRLTEEALVTRLGRERAFRDPDVLTVDPAMGTGTYLHTILERVAEQAEAADGPGAVAGVLRQVAERLVGFELQMGPFAVAELRATDLLASHGASAPASGMRFYVTDTLDDPNAAMAELGSGLRLIAESRRRANEVKRKANVTVVVGNPPYLQPAEGTGGWVEHGSRAHGRTARPILDDFRRAGNGRVEYVLKNSHVYFWRWATWKVWESTPTDADDGDAGVICFITTSGYLRGPGFKGMREYLRRHASEGWVIDLTPEGHTPDVPTRIFPGVRQPLAIGLFIRKPDARREIPATIHYRAVHGRQADKFEKLAQIRLDDDGWREARSDWTAPLTPAAGTGWDEYPALNDLMPWSSPGVKPNKTWVYSPSRSLLTDRWQEFVASVDLRERAVLLKGTVFSADRVPLKPLPAQLFEVPPPFPGEDGIPPTGPLSRETGPRPPVVRAAFRVFDRQWLLADSRLVERGRPDLWAARREGQVFAVEQHAHPIEDGPGVVFASLLPDQHHFNNRGGRTLPLLHPDGSPNLAPGLVRALSAEFGREVAATDVLAYVAGVVAHPGFTRTFADELTTPGLRVPVTADGDLFAEAVALGEQVIWLHSYGETYAGTGRPSGAVRYARGDERQPQALTPVTRMPTDVIYDADRSIIVLGDGEFGPVREEAWNYDVGGRNVIKSWVNYRKAEPGGKKNSPLDRNHVDEWDPDWTTEFIDLLTVLTRLVELEPEQADLLERVLASPVLGGEALRLAGVRWPSKPTDRKPRYGIPAAATEAPMLDL